MKGTVQRVRLGARGVSSFILAPSLLAFLLLPLASTMTHAQSSADVNLLETGAARKISVPRASPAWIKVVSYNIRWRGGEELRKLIELFKTDAEVGGAFVLGLQEVDRNKKRTGNANTARQMAEALGMYYAWAAPPSAGKDTEEETGVCVLSPYPLTDVRRILLPNEGPGGRRRVALGATVQIGTTSVRVYSVHAETRVSMEMKLEQYAAVLDDLAAYDKTTGGKPLPAIVLGDFNTWQASASREVPELFTRSGFATPFPKDLATFRWKSFLGSVELKLDWLWLRGLAARAYGVNRRIELSDHWPLWADVRMSDEHETMKR